MHSLGVSVAFNRTCSANAKKNKERYQHFVDGANGILSLLKTVERQAPESASAKELQFIVHRKSRERRLEVVLTCRKFVRMGADAVNYLGHPQEARSEHSDWEKCLMLLQFAENSQGPLDSPEPWNPELEPTMEAAHVTAKDLENYRKTLPPASMAELLQPRKSALPHSLSCPGF